MKNVRVLLAVFVLMLSFVLPAYGADGRVTYDGNAKDIIFEPGSDHSPTDLFPNFKDVMPGDTLTQQITVKNEASNEVKVDIYIRSLGAHEDSVEFLSQLGLKVKASDENEMAYMFDAAAHETAGLTDWVCLGTLYSGGEVNLDVTLTVPVELDNAFQSQIGYLDWEFRVEEFPVEEGDPTPPPTGEDFSVALWVTVPLLSLGLILFLIFWRKKEQKEDEPLNTQS